MHIVNPPLPATLAWFTTDLRVHDNAVLNDIFRSSSLKKQPLLCLYCIDPNHYETNQFGVCSLGEHRERFLLESLDDLDQQLKSLGQRLLVAKGKPEKVITDLLARYHFTTVVSSQQLVYNEREVWRRLQEKHPHHQFMTQETLTLFQRSLLPFPDDALPTSFSKFRTRIESSELIQSIKEQQAINIDSLPPSMNVTLKQEYQFDISQPSTAHKKPFIGGESTGVEHVMRYFSGKAPQHYKQTRNALGCEDNEWYSSSKFSPWLANGSLSARYIVKVLDEYEQAFGANESTYWILFELLWREYFQWYALEHGAKLFYRKGIQQQAPLLTFYPQRFQQWCQGNTPWSLVNACMKQLNQTGFLSNRGRQIVASCLIYELGIDWRCGAAYFEQQLIDYDAASNWGNWQYIAGVGADPRGGRRFNIEKQQQQYDPEEIYIQRWTGKQTVTAIDSVDAADWPLGH